MARKPADQSVNKDDILFAAAEVLRNNGYESTTMKDIAAKVNLTAASLYHHFKNKDYLVLAVLERGLSFAIEQIEPIVHSQQTNHEKLRQMIAVHVVNVTENMAFGAAMIFEIRSLLSPNNTNGIDEDEANEFIERRNLFFGVRDYFESLFRQVVVDGIESGEFREVDVRIFTKAMLGAHNWVALWYNPAGQLTGKEVADIMADTFLASLDCH